MNYNENRKIVAIGSVFRNSAHYLSRYFVQALDLSALLSRDNIRLRFILVEGDSSDDTWEKLARWTNGLDAVLVKRDHGGPVFSSVDDPQRWAQLAFACNGVLDHVTADVDALVYVESDLAWQADHMIRLVSHVISNDLDSAGPDAVAAMCFTGDPKGPRGPFYDIWGHAKDGISFSPFPPYHPGLNGSRLVTIDSAGSCVVVGRHVLRRIRGGQVRFSPVDCIRGYCRTIRTPQFLGDFGAPLYLDTQVEVRHL